MKLMIVDDSKIVQNMIQRFLSEKDIELAGKANNGKEALEIYKLIRPEIVTMDITMPEMDGIQAVKEIVAIDENVRILVVSALADKATAIEALKNGAHGFLCKPFDERELNDALYELIEDLLDE